MTQIVSSFEMIYSNSFESINSIETTLTKESINVPMFKKYKKKSINTKIILDEENDIVMLIHNIINTLKLNNISYILKKNYKFNCCYSDNHICLLFNIYLSIIPNKPNEFILEAIHKKGNKKFLIEIFNAIINNSKINNTQYDNKNSILSNPYINNIINDYIKMFNLYFINNQQESYYKILCNLNELSSKKDYHSYLINNNTHIIILNLINVNELLTNNDIICHILALSCLLTLSENDMFKKEIKITHFNNIKKTTKKYINEIIDNKITKIIVNLQN